MSTPTKLATANNGKKNCEELEIPRSTRATIGLIACLQVFVRAWFFVMGGPQTHPASVPGLTIAILLSLVGLYGVYSCKDMYLLFFSHGNMLYTLTAFLTLISLKVDTDHGVTAPGITGVFENDWLLRSLPAIETALSTLGIMLSYRASAPDCLKYSERVLYVALTFVSTALSTDAARADRSSPFTFSTDGPVYGGMWSPFVLLAIISYMALAVWYKTRNSSKLLLLSYTIASALWGVVWFIEITVRSEGRKNFYARSASGIMSMTYAQVLNIAIALNLYSRSKDGEIYDRVEQVEQAPYFAA